MFRIIKVANKKFYRIESICKKFKFSYLINNENPFISRTNNKNLWKFIKINENNFLIKNGNNNCFIQVKNLKIFCENIPDNKATPFKLIRIFSEVNMKKNKKNNEILNQEPIDILIKYIDLKDPKLKREGIHQIEKDFDNEELRYSVRSILINIPWVRKIYILMPNEKVRYFKDFNLINEKIIYIKDKDLLGYDSSNIYAFEYRYWKMKKFGISDNVIIMDDDYFIGSKLKKSDFFYVDKKKVFPSIVTSYFIEIEKEMVVKYRDLFRKKALTNILEQNDDWFNYSKYLTFSYILDLFNISYGEKVFIPKFTHNAIPINLKDIKEIYDIIHESHHKNTTLDSLYRHIESLQFHILTLSYSFIKYDRKIHNIPFLYTTLNNPLIKNYKFPLICINKRAGFYSYSDFYKSKIVMEYLFPQPTPYELIDYSLINLSFNIVYSLNKDIKNLKNKISNLKKKKENCKICSIKDRIFFIVILSLFKINYKCYSYHYL